MNTLYFILALLGGAFTYQIGFAPTLGVFFGAMALLQLKDFTKRQIKKEKNARTRERINNY